MAATGTVMNSISLYFSDARRGKGLNRGAKTRIDRTAQNDNWNPGANSCRGLNARIMTAATHSEL